MSHRVISTILRHDSKQASYKIALLRALNDVVLMFPDLLTGGRDVAVPLSTIAELWIAYYWPFMAPDAPVLQGIPTLRRGVASQDLAFRSDLTGLRSAWQGIHGSSSPADGFVVINEMRVPRKRRSYPEAFLSLYQRVVSKVASAVRQPIQYAGAGRWAVFPRPQQRRDLENATAVPGTAPNDICLLVRADLWSTFREVSLWVEALCVHEWSLFTERIDGGVDRGVAYRLLTEHPASRLPLTWERNQVDLLIEVGADFRCPWTHKRLVLGAYHLDHIIPVTIYPFNELWNLVPADPNFNVHKKRDRMPTVATMDRASPLLAATYTLYQSSPALGRALKEDVAVRFAVRNEPDQVVAALRQLVEGIADARNLARF